MTRNEYSKQSRCQGSWGVVQSTIKVMCIKFYMKWHFEDEIVKPKLV